MILSLFRIILRIVLNNSLPRRVKTVQTEMAQVAPASATAPCYGTSGQLKVATRLVGRKSPTRRESDSEFSRIRARRPFFQAIFVGRCSRSGSRRGSRFGKLFCNDPTPGPLMTTTAISRRGEERSTWREFRKPISCPAMPVTIRMSKRGRHSSSGRTSLFLLEESP